MPQERWQQAWAVGCSCRAGDHKELLLLCLSVCAPYSRYSGQVRPALAPGLIGRDTLDMHSNRLRGLCGHHRLNHACHHRYRTLGSKAQMEFCRHDLMGRLEGGEGRSWHTFLGLIAGKIFVCRPVNAWAASHLNWMANHQQVSFLPVLLLQSNTFLTIPLQNHDQSHSLHFTPSSL